MHSLRLPGVWADRLVDVFVGVFSMMAAVVLQLEMAASRGSPAVTPALAVAAVHGASVVLRRVRPWLVLAVLMATAIIYVVLGFPAFMLGPAVLFVIYSIGAVQQPRASLIALGSLEATVAVALIVGPKFPGLPAVVFYLAIIAVAWWLGYLVRRWRTAADEHSRRADELAATREELARYAVAEERRRIARELHDVVAHSMTVVAMHAGTARLVAADDPTSALSSLGMMERLSREAVTEMRRLVGLLRDDAHSGEGLAPTPGLTDLHGLIAEMVAAGLAVEVHIDGRVDEVPAGPSLAAFRIAQEALTNVAKHSGLSKVLLRVSISDSELTLEIENEAPSSEALRLAQHGPGLGLIGMRERVHLYNGSLTAGPVPGGGFRVAARIPLDREGE